MTLQETIANSRLEANQNLRFAVADIGSALFVTNKEEIQHSWVEEQYPDVSIIDIQVALALKGIHVDKYHNRFVIYPSKAVYKLLER
jgi:hypothetical protein